MAAGIGRLQQGLIALSEGKQWPRMLEEWDLDVLEYIERDEEPETCLCDHYPIREVCYIINHVNGNMAIVENSCVKKLEGETTFKKIPKIFAALKRMRKNIAASANIQLINYACAIDILSKQDQVFYLNIWRKKNLSGAQMTRKVELNQRIVGQLIRGYPRETAQPVQAVALRSVPDAMTALRANPAALADPLLVLHAYQQNEITGEDYEFYRSLFANKVRNISAEEQEQLNEINQDILR